MAAPNDDLFVAVAADAADAAAAATAATEAFFVAAGAGAGAGAAGRRQGNRCGKGSCVPRCNTRSHTMLS